ncbi:MAG TPA: hypothetical protein VGM76_15840 [Lacipirellulaceae bacterium]|jgi:hypothetical protein
MILNLMRAIAHHGCVLAVVGVMARQTSAKQEQESYNYYHVDAAVVSLDANQSLASYRSYGSASGSPGAKLGLSTSEDQIGIELTIESDHFYADVTVGRQGKSGEDGAKEERIDLTSLRPTSLDLGSDKEGRVYQLNLTPSVALVQLRPKSFQEAADDLYRLKFHSSRIILNDKQYVGRMLASDAEVFSVEVCGVASLEFSLRHLKGAEPWGKLENGQITLNHPDGTSIEIGNVGSGADDRLVGGGPYVVWVRWNKPHQTVEEYRSELAAYRDRVKSDTANVSRGNTNADTLAFIEQELAREPGPWVTACGACALPKQEIVHDE